MRLIDADALMKVLDIAEKCNDCRYGLRCFGMISALKVFEAVGDAPTIEAEPVGHGKRKRIWSPTIYDCTSSLPHYVCSECGSITLWESAYCPTCGARMEVENG